MSLPTRTSSTIVKPPSSCWISERGIGTGLAAFVAFATFAAGCAGDLDGALEHAASAREIARIRCLADDRIGSSTRRSSTRSVHCRGSGGGGRSSCRRPIRIAVDRSQEAGADLRLGVTARHHLGQARETLLDPAVEHLVAAHQLEILLVHLDGLLFERERLFVERVLVFL